MGGLGATSARMQSASLMCISCVLFHHRSDEAIVPLMRDAMHITYGLLESKSREVAKACFGLIRTCVKVLPEEIVQEEMHDAIGALQPWSNDHYGNFKLRVKAIFELILRRLGKQTMESLLTEEEKTVLDPILGIKDLRKDKRIDFVGGIRGLKELQTRVDSGDFIAAFALYPTQMSELTAVADSGQVMPPKSTWFEPKLADGLISNPI